ncbi:MAG TPA: sulfide-dependent adenosine diphosphate thiazole synthase [Dehalococcoidia bacterium]|nr:sulfide-dependent adenosine diphosphate thiazole synthase [Dehalococcoidia bacterium]
MDEIIISKAITESYIKDLLEAMELDVAIVGAGPAGMTAAYYLAKEKVKTAIFERKLSIGGGLWGGGMMFNKVVVQPEGKKILDEFGITATEYQKGYYVANAVEVASTLCSLAVKAGARIFNLISVVDVVIREADRVSGLVLNWSPVSMANLHIDPLAIRSKLVIDATGHDCEICRLVTEKVEGKLRTTTGKIMGEKSMWAEVGEKEVVENTKEVYPGLIATGMAATAVFGSPRMGPIFGGMLLSGKKAAKLAIELLKKG